jgi:schlafen family protein/4-fold beta-flower domain-containing protein
MTIRSWSDAEDLLAHKIPESPSLEYKSTLSLSNSGERRETLKDLTGIGNGGGGSILFGIEEDGEHDGVPTALTPLHDAMLIGILEDICRTSVRPPLLMEITKIGGEDGDFILAVEILRSPLGPYMVEAYGERRYFTRQGTRTSPMDEQQVRDAYLLAARGREHRQQTWVEHQLPLRAQTDDPWLTLCGLPEEPLLELLGVSDLDDLDRYRPPDSMRVLTDMANLRSVNFRRWAEGAYASDRYDTEHPPSSIIRIHRDGAAGVGTRLHSEKLPIRYVARILNGQLAYLAWLWELVGVRTPVEVEALVDRLTGANVDAGWPEDPKPVQQPPGLSVESVRAVQVFTPHDLSRASLRHRFIRELSAKLHHAFGTRMPDISFRTGWLHGPDGRPIEVSAGGSGIWDAEGRRKGHVFDSGRVTNLNNDRTIGYLVDGVLLDDAGRAIACAEMAVGGGLPDSYFPPTVMTDLRYQVSGGDPGAPMKDSDPDATTPSGTGLWSPTALTDLLEP